MNFLKCADCKRALRAKPALTIGEYHFGPKCARRYIIKPARTLSAPVIEYRRRAVAPDAAQLSLELEVA